MSRQAKFDYLKNCKRCLNCLGLHNFKYCASNNSCRICKSTRHHTSLHPDNQSVNQSDNLSDIPNNNSLQIESKVSESESAAPNEIINSYHIDKRSICVGQVLLGTVQARIESADGTKLQVRAVLDPGSQISAISQKLVKKLGLKINSINMSISGIGQTNAQPLGLIDCKLYPKTGLEYLQVHAVVLPEITNNIPSAPLSQEIIKHFEHLNLADETFHISQPIDILLGADTYSIVFERDGRISSPGYPTAVNTFFGWTIIGPINEMCSSTKSVLLTQSDLGEQMQKFWSLEEGGETNIIDPVDDYVEKHFVSTHFRDESGRYVVSIPFKLDNPYPVLSFNSKRSLKSYFSIENRLMKDEASLNLYNDFMSEYLKLNHMSRAKTSNSYVIPHHVVRKDSSSTTKLRVVFNASDLDSLGKSLNDMLLGGPKLQKDIQIILLSFRMYPIVICADVEKMYRQILVCPSDRKFQHIYWRSSPDQPVTEFELNTVTYGLKPSAFLALRVLKQLVFDEGKDFPRASKVLDDDIYVDDILTGAFNVQEAIELRDELQVMLKKGGFSLKKFSSNCLDILNDLPPDHIEAKLDFNDDNMGIKILGLSWIPAVDSFIFNVNEFNEKPSKRSILSYIARIFDPVGFLSPIVISMKLLIQKLWSEKHDWDDPLSDACHGDRSRIVNKIQLLSNIKIPRSIISAP
ncbi:uncharacterized protein LOC123671351 [Harmonia axyridis]|uniref:uncharacterized protein LOC123671351 n=1 Tax=Harmonia axyridis TaxID=115357 RepID=UPI001E276874|nr:uncharacterized protein LOC123671351 [Harmonia axyridis]